MIKAYFQKTNIKLLDFFSVLLPISIMAILTIPNLGNREMWADEAYNVVLGKRVLQFGYPKVWDGYNLISFENGAYFINLIEMHSDWFPIYLVAFGSIFSASLFGIRIWFVILGLLSAVFFYRFTKQFVGDDNVAALALWLYCLSVPIIIYTRVAYYYGPSLLFIIMSCFYCTKIEHHKMRINKVFFICSMILLFYTNYLFFSILAISLFVYLLITTKSIEAIIKTYLDCAIIILIFTMPFLIAKIIYLQQFGTPYNRATAEQFGTQILGYIWQIQVYFTPLITLGFLMLIKFLINLLIKKENHVDDNILNKKKNKAPLFYVLPITVILSNLVFISYFAWDYATRWLIVSVPFIYMLSAIFIMKLFKKDKVALVIFTVILIFSNILHELPYFIIKNNVNGLTEALVKPPVNFYWEVLPTTDLPEYLSDLKIKSTLLIYSSSYLKNHANSDKAAVKFAKKFINSGEFIYTTTFATHSLMYHTNGRIINFYKNPNDMIINDLYINNIRPITWAQNLKYFTLSYRPIEYIDWIIVYTQDLLNDSFSFTPHDVLDIIKDEKLFERFDIYDHPNVSVASDIWRYTFETSDNNYNNGISIFRNRLTTSTINVPNIITKEHLE
ncbi:MAG: hypothetical protein FWG91_01335 [Lachnospiraceae bacterium]|nr:hypothetical protein [Lachnospiraceae bacterium]